MRIPLAILLVMLPLLAGAQVYKWVDDKGHVHYGDRQPEAQQKQMEQVDVNVNVVHAESKSTFVPYKMPAPHPGKKVVSVGSKSSRDNASGNSCEAQWQRYNQSTLCYAACSKPLYRTDGYGHDVQVGTNTSGCHCQDLKKPSCKR